MRRFERITQVVELVEEYRRGGYHPVHMHDIFDRRYEVVGKLAYGQFSTVWLAKDKTSTHQHVSLKILKADASADSKELLILRHLAASQLDHPGKSHVVELLDHFYHTGPNGVHLCLVFPVMISDLQEIIVTWTPRQAGYVETMSHQILLGLDFLHRSDIVHCADLQPGNMLVAVTDSMNDTKAFLEPPQFSPVRWLEGVTKDDSAPQYLMPSQRRYNQLKNVQHSSLVVKIGDLGGAQFRRQCNERPVTPLSLRAPEIIHGSPWDWAIDIWALGCLIFEIATNEPLFPLCTFGIQREEVNKEHLELIDERMCDPAGQAGFAAYLAERLQDDFGAENIQRLAKFLLLMLRVDREERCCTKELLQDAFTVNEH
ncbi:serine protein kinase [Aspergillus vadensis CBS 113365]|uniref:non-specific serine/threonine protein kinase n=1 Tax=Aspergillus vadensis (strain CBS 113365 / IMI 142717 / IBT 24658) TaxID=1448311 RepID=A0A319C4M2_ASPVC|nr:serine protein kinase [Aspergillus vadensis CBS 113365]PYH63742.1 serine protein kinase [Aspergillus vadensis CBS 113365]